MVSFRLNVGDTFLVNGIYRDAAGNPIDLRTAGIAITAAAQSSDGLKTYELVVEHADQDATLGGYTISGDTSGWQPGDALKFNVRFTQGDRSFSSRTYTFGLRRGPA